MRGSMRVKRGHRTMGTRDDRKERSVILWIWLCDTCQILIGRCRRAYAERVVQNSPSFSLYALHVLFLFLFLFLPHFISFLSPLSSLSLSLSQLQLQLQESQEHNLTRSEFRSDPI
ncbi:hypothetical protein RIF29_18854 [Crotalaria pallida]|uniref:Transmembrane protein n=1 Tax=Crotalaria pallida TaxID=3830 RepID=A0AAN9I4Z6_CROPI